MKPDAPVTQTGALVISLSMSVDCGVCCWLSSIKSLSCSSFFYCNQNERSPTNSLHQISPICGLAGGNETIKTSGDDAWVYTTINSSATASLAEKKILCRVFSFARKERQTSKMTAERDIFRFTQQQRSSYKYFSLWLERKERTSLPFIYLAEYESAQGTTRYFWAGHTMRFCGSVNYNSGLVYNSVPVGSEWLKVSSRAAVQ